MVPVYTVEKLEVHPHDENFRPQVGATMSQRLKRQQAHTSYPVHLPTYDVYNALHADV